MHDHDGQSSNSENRSEPHIFLHFMWVFSTSSSSSSSSSHLSVSVWIFFLFLFYVFRFILVWHLMSFSYSIWSLLGWCFFLLLFQVLNSFFQLSKKNISSVEICYAQSHLYYKVSIIWTQKIRDSQRNHQPDHFLSSWGDFWQKTILCVQDTRE